eukprot:PRCOL_00002415-RA
MRAVAQPSRAAVPRALRARRRRVARAEAASTGGGGGAAAAATQAPPARTTMLDKLKEYGMAGVLSYGVFNTTYYIVAFCVGARMVDLPAGAGIAAVCRKLAEVLAVVWVGSQATKPLRAGAALTLAPFADRLLGATASRLGMGRAGAFAAITASCFAAAAAVFAAVALAVA